MDVPRVGQVNVCKYDYVMYGIIVKANCGLTVEFIA